MKSDLPDFWGRIGEPISNAQLITVFAVTLNTVVEIGLALQGSILLPLLTIYFGLILVLTGIRLRRKHIIETIKNDLLASIQAPKSHPKIP